MFHLKHFFNNEKHFEFRPYVQKLPGFVKSPMLNTLCEAPIHEDILIKVVGASYLGVQYLNSMMDFILGMTPELHIGKCRCCLHQVRHQFGLDQGVAKSLLFYKSSLTHFVRFVDKEVDSVAPLRDFFVAVAHRFCVGVYTSTFRLFRT